MACLAKPKSTFMVSGDEEGLLVALSAKMA